MVSGKIKVTVVPDTTILDKELKKKRTFTGLLGLGRGGGGAEADKGELKSSKKTNSLLGGILKSVGAIFGLNILFSGLFRLLKPFVELFTALSFLVWFPLWKALKPVLVGLSKFVKNVAAEGGGITGLVKGAEKTAEEALEGTSVFKRIGIAIAAGIIGILAIAAVVILATITSPFIAAGLLIVAAITALITLLILAWDPLMALFNIIVQAFKDFFSDIKISFGITVDFIKNLGKDIWQFILDGLAFIADLGSKIWDFFLSGLSFISDLGVKIWNFIKKSLAGIGGGLVSGAKKAASFLNPFDDFIQRPGQSAVSFSPRDTIIGVKDPNALFGGGGGTTINNVFNLSATINNDMDVRNLALRIAEINKEELAMSTSSQRF